jgi:uncharacterized OB-fold protein
MASRREKQLAGEIMSLEFSLCNNCGGVFHPDEVEQGYCYNCSPDSGEEAPELDMSRIVTDCE